VSDEVSFKSLFHLLAHILIAGVLFCAVAGVAISLWYATVLMEKHDVPDEIRVPCHYVATFLFAVDIFSLVVYVLSEVWKWLKEIAEGIRK